MARDKITINELSDYLKQKIESSSTSTNNSYSKSEIDTKIDEVKEMIQNITVDPSQIDLSNYYTKSEAEVFVSKLISTAIVEHNTDTKSHNGISTKVSDITKMLSNLSISTRAYKLDVTQDMQTEFTISDTSFTPGINIGSIVVWNTIVLTDYTINGRILTFSSGINLGSNLTLVVFSIEGVI